MEKHPINLTDEHHDSSFALQNIYEKSKLNFMAITENVTVKFSWLLKLLKKLDLEKLHKNQGKKPLEEDITLPSNLLLELSDAEPNKQQKSMNLLSGVFLIGILIGCLGTVIIMLGLINSKVEINNQLLMYMGLGFFIALAIVIGIPILLAAVEPFLKKVQEKHHDFMDRIVNFFQQ
jgi:hypothetical protein